MIGFYVDPYPGIWYNICAEEYPTGKLVEAIKGVGNHPQWMVDRAFFCNKPTLGVKRRIEYGREHRHEQ